MSMDRADTPVSQETTEASGPDTAPKQEINIVLAGKSGAGKSTLVKNVFEAHLKLQMSASATNNEHMTYKYDNNDITANIIDTAGLMVKNKKEQFKEITKHVKGEVHLLLYCLPIGPGSRFEDSNPDIMKSLQDAFGKDIWQHCLVVLTFSNLAWNHICMDFEEDGKENIVDSEAAINAYTGHIQLHVECFDKELRKLGISPRTVGVKSVFELQTDDLDQPEQPNKYDIIATPAGYNLSDKVLPGVESRHVTGLAQGEQVNWAETLIYHIVQKRTSESSLALMQFGSNWKMITNVFGGPIGSIIGGAVGFAIGMAIGVSSGVVQKRGADNTDITGDTKKDEKSSQIIQEIADAALGNQKVKRKLAHGMFVGPTGAGKTSLMDRLLGRKRKEFSPSTGVADPVVAVNVTLHAVTVSEGNTWKEVEYDESIVKQMGKESSTTDLPHSIPHKHTPAYSKPTAADNTRSTSHATPDAPIVLPDHEATETLTFKVNKVLQSIRSFVKRRKLKHSTKEMIRHIINRCGGSKEFKEQLMKTFSLYLRDTGGQVEFQEMLPLLISGPSIFFFVFRLDLDFKSKFTVEYRKSAGESLNCYTSSITTEEAFLQFLASVYAMDTSGKVSVKTHKPLVFVIGTHRDKLGELANKKIAELNEHLDRLIKNSGFWDLIQYADRCKGHVMFTVDNTSDNDEDIELIRSNVSNLIHGRNEFTIEFPIRYLLFSLELQYVQHGILSLKEVKNIAAQCGISGDELLPLLQFLHLRMGIIRYYDKDGVRHIVIREPQLLFNAVTSLIMKTFSSEAMTTAEADNFEKKGILTASTLASVCRCEGLTPEEFLRLLVHLRLTAPFPSTGDQHQENRYFFPSVLNHVQEYSKGSLHHTNILPLAIKFQCNHVPNGLFNVLVTHLMNPDLEEGATSNTTTFTLMQDKIFKDQVSFEVHSPGVQDEMALKLHHSHLEIKFFPEHSEDRDTSITEVCSNVRQILETSIQQSLRDLHYNMDRTAPEMCLRCDHCSELHVVKKGIKLLKMYCRKVRATKNIPSQGECWFREDKLSYEPSVQPPVQPPSTVSTGRLQDSDMVWLCEKLGQYAYKWKDIALGLGFTSAELSTIEATPLLLTGAPFSYLRAVLSSWLQWAPGDVRGSTDYATTDTLRRAVDRAGLGLTAREL